MLVLAFCALGLLAYVQIFWPDRLAADFDKRLTASAGQLNDCFGTLADTQQLEIYETPDLNISDKRKQLDSIRQTLGECGKRLEAFTATAQSLPQLRFSGYSYGYRDAFARQRHAVDIAGQCRDVLRQHSRSVSYLDEHLTVLPPFLEYTSAVNHVEDVSLLAGRAPQLAAQAGQLHGIAERIRATPPAAGMSGLAQPTAAMFSQAADGMDHLASGYRLADDSRIDIGFTLVEGAVETYDNSVAAMSFDLFLAAPSNTQVTELPGKLNDFLHPAAK
jgi:hypothetical protein